MSERDIIKAREEYLEARKQAKLRYHQEVSRGHSGFIPALEGTLEHTPIMSEQHIGLEEVPLHKIAGTLTQSRARSFASGYLPLPDTKSEFSMKWTSLYQHQMETGITDPVVLKEYLNWYWVVEGNKRVSVLNYLGAYKIDAMVTRLLPPRQGGNPTVEVYYRFLDFKTKTGLSDIWIREPGGYSRLLAFISNGFGGGPESIRSFKSDLYKPFRKIYKECGGDSLALTTGEALLRFMELAGMQLSIGEGDREKIRSLVKELGLPEEETGVTTEPIKQASPGFLTSIGQFFKSGAPLRIGFIHYEDPDVSLWSQAHEEARLHLNEEFGKRIRTKSWWVAGDRSAFTQVLSKAAKSSDIVFSTAAILYEATMATALSYPKVRFFVSSRKKSSYHLRTFSPRTHEVHYLSGMLAGVLGRNRPVGFFVSNYSAYAFASINAFTLGARAVDPQARVQVFWSDHWKDEQSQLDHFTRMEGRKTGELLFYNILPGSRKQDFPFGLYGYRNGAFSPYATISYNWRELYSNLVENILAGSWTDFEPESGESPRILTFWGGIRNKIVDLQLEQKVLSAETVRLVNGMRTLMKLGEFSPFYGPVRDREGRLRVGEGGNPDYDQVIAMDYLVEGVEGDTPEEGTMLTT
jgi:basic membrane protein A and related proteins